MIGYISPQQTLAPSDELMYTTEESAYRYLSQQEILQVDTERGAR